MSKSDLKARPIFHHTREAIEAHLTIVMAALAVSHRLQTITGKSVTKVIETLEPLHEMNVNIAGQNPPRPRPDPTRSPNNPRHPRPHLAPTLKWHESGWNWKNQPGLYSGKHHHTGLNLQVACDLTGRLAWVLRPGPGRHP